jgi:hypothetical protein
MLFAAASATQRAVTRSSTGSTRPATAGPASARTSAGAVAHSDARTPSSLTGCTHPDTARISSAPASAISESPCAGGHSPAIQPPPCGSRSSGATDRRPAQRFVLQSQQVSQRERPARFSGVASRTNGKAGARLATRSPERSRSIFRSAGTRTKVHQLKWASSAAGNAILNVMALCRACGPVLADERVAGAPGVLARRRGGAPGPGTAAGPGCAPHVAGFSGA